MIRNTLILGVLVVNTFVYSIDKKYTQQEYVSLWKEIAISQMHEHGIPASITLAQGLLESASGNSELARNANNHFGIKCSDWKGETYLKDDNQKNECFRKYPEASKSYLDHSQFLKKSRYLFLYNYDKKDYKSWANGLKQAGYATNPNYPKLLIELIERLKLNELDENSNENLIKYSTLVTTHSVLKHSNNINYVVCKKGDTFYRLSKELNISLWQLHKYNEFSPKKDCLVEGDIVFIQPKKGKSVIPSTKLKKEMTPREISQQEGVKVKKIMKYNNILSADEELEKGTIVFLK
jgi:LysM repeat protein